MIAKIGSGNMKVSTGKTGESRSNGGAAAKVWFQNEES